MHELDWTRIYLDSLRRSEVEFEQPLFCEETRRATASCPSWQDAVLDVEVLNIVESIQQMAAEMRAAYRLPETSAIVVDMPRWMEAHLTQFDRELIESGAAYVNWID